MVALKTEAHLPGVSLLQAMMDRRGEKGNPHQYVSLLPQAGTETSAI
jgi:hypothetical protein